MAYSTQNIPVKGWSAPHLRTIITNDQIHSFVSPDELAEYLGVTRGRVMSLIAANRLLAQRFHSKCWIIPVDIEGKPFVSLATRGPQPSWKDKVNSNFPYFPGESARKLAETLHKIEQEIEEV